jgi:hypothetical protein
MGVPYQMMLDEVLLNPSTQKMDEQRLSRQCRSIFGLFCARRRMGMLVTTADLMAEAGQYNARINELRRAIIKIGWCIDLVKRNSDGNNGYELVPIENSEFYAKHRNKLDGCECDT